MREEQSESEKRLTSNLPGKYLISLRLALIPEGL
jgi:hypothetical protein